MSGASQGLVLETLLIVIHVGNLHAEVGSIIIKYEHVSAYDN